MNDLIDWLSHTRYLEVRVNVRRNTDQRMSYLLYDLASPSFKKFFRVGRPMFFSLVQLIKQHCFDVFHGVHGKRQKGTVATHILILLRFLGVNGNACSLQNLGEFFVIGAGTVQSYIDRGIDALHRLKPSYITWPLVNERAAIARQIRDLGLLDSNSTFDHCVGFLDGTIFPFETKPQMDGAEDYYIRKAATA